MPNATLKIGFVPLVDCALLAVAQEQHFFAANGLRVELRKAQSWAAVRDNLAAGELDAAHLLITMPLQSFLSADARAEKLCYAFTLSRNGNGIIISNSLWNDGVRDAAGLSAWMRARPSKPIRLGVVFARGTQEYLLRSWLAMGGLSINDRITLTVIPPQEMVGRLRKGEIDGFCAGEPWSRRAAASKLGRLVAESGGMLPGLGEKVLGVRVAWHGKHPREHGHMIRALSDASAWLADPANLDVAVELLASKRYVNTSKTVVEAALKDAATLRRAAVLRESVPGILPGGDPMAMRFAGYGPDFPARTHAQWYLEQMHRFGHAGALASARLDVTAVCLEEFYRESVSGLGVSPAGPVFTGPAATVFGSKSSGPAVA
jgi:ABC-type nitrate/sulfonate/bicarbonate transport system substrate-binding protein